MKEKIVIIFIALAIGLFATTIGFYFYQSGKDSLKNNVSNTSERLQSPKISKNSESLELFLNVDEPKDESLTDTRKIEVKGKTNPQNTLIVSSNIDDIIENPAIDGSFSINLSIEAGSNILTIRAVSPGGDEKTEQKVVTYSAEEF